MRRGVKEGLQRRLAEAPPALMGAFFIVAFDPGIEIALQFGNRSVDFLAEDDTVELIQHRLVESLNNAIRLRALGLGAGMIDVLERQSAAHSSRRYRVAALWDLVGYAFLTECGLLHRKIKNHRLAPARNPFLKKRFAPLNFLRRAFPASVIEFIEP